MRVLSRILPHPLLSLILAVVWCLLVNSLSLGTVVLSLILAVLIPLLTEAYWPDRPDPPRLGRLTLYVLLVIWDIALANIAVAWIVLTRPNAKMRSRWVVIPLDLKTPEAIAILAGTITLTPGTVSADLSNGGSCLLVHALDTGDAEDEAKGIKQRYERRLKEIFE